jgi:glycine cleavage system aminomethyltransferase T
MDSLRLERSIAAGSDMTHEYTPLMASLDRFIDFKPKLQGLRRW